MRAVRYSRVKNYEQESVFEGCEGLRNESGESSESSDEIKALVDEEEDSFEVSFQNIRCFNNPKPPAKSSSKSAAVPTSSKQTAKKYYFDSPDDRDTILTDDYVKELEIERRAPNLNNGSINNVLYNRGDGNSDDDLLDDI